MYMLQEIDILEDWTAIKKVGPVLPVSGWGLAVQRPLPNQAPALVFAGSPRVDFLRAWEALCSALGTLCLQPGFPGIA